MAVVIPLDALLAPPRMSSVTLSPDGSRIAYVAPVDGVANVWVKQVGDDASARPVTTSRDARAHTPFWAFDNRHICYLRDNFGDENWHLHAVDVDTGADRDLTPFDGVRVEVVGASRQHPGGLVVALNRNDPAAPDAYRLDIESGQLDLLVRNPGGITAPAPHLPGAGFVARADLTIGAVTMAGDRGCMEVRADDGAGASPDFWPVVRAWDFEDTRTSSAIGFSPDADVLYLVDSVGAETARLLALEVASGHATVLAGDDAYDLSSVVLGPSHEPVAVMVERDRACWTALDPSLARIVEDLNTRPDAHAVRLVLDGHGQRFLVAWSSPQRGIWWEVDGWFAGSMFELDAYTLPTRTPVTYTARDGLTIEGYVTAPPGGDDDDGAPGPMVLFPHGGPWHRDSWDFDPIAGWLADRGYVVLQPNFRGSTGYGKSFVNAGNREWGAKMHDDLIDGVQWAVDAGLADPNRVAIFGGSYGGYAALVGATFTPTTFACIVDMFGWGDLIAALTSMPAYWGPRRAQWYERVGNPDTEPEFLWSRSPLSRIDRLCRPILIAQGGNDVRVRPESSEQVVAALVERGIEHEYLFFADEGHGFVNPQNMQTFYAAAERFLARHLRPGE